MEIGTMLNKLCESVVSYIVVLCFSLILSACNGTGSSGSGSSASMLGNQAVGTNTVKTESGAFSEYAYVLDNVNNTIYAYKAEGNKLIELPDGHKDLVGSKPSDIKVSPNNRYVYVTNSYIGSVSQYSIDQGSGILSAKSLHSISTGIQPVSLTFTPDNKFAYVVNRGSHSISQYSVIESTGELVFLPVLSTATHMQYPRYIAASHDSHFIYVANNTTSDVESSTFETYSIMPDGSLKYVNSIVAGSSKTRSLLAANNNSALYSTYDSTSDTSTPLSASSYQISKDGLLTNTRMVYAGESATTMTITPNNKFAYISNRFPYGTLYRYSCNYAGALAFVESMVLPDSNSGSTVGLAADNAQHLYVLNADAAHSLLLYKINESGGLSYLGALGNSNSSSSLKHIATASILSNNTRPVMLEPKEKSTASTDTRIKIQLPSETKNPELISKNNFKISQVLLNQGSASKGSTLDYTLEKMDGLTYLLTPLAGLSADAKVHVEVINVEDTTGHAISEGFNFSTVEKAWLMFESSASVTVGFSGKLPAQSEQRVLLQQYIGLPNAAHVYGGVGGAPIAAGCLANPMCWGPAIVITGMVALASTQSGSAEEIDLMSPLDPYSTYRLAIERVTNNGKKLLNDYLPPTIFQVDENYRPAYGAYMSTPSIKQKNSAPVDKVAFTLYGSASKVTSFVVTDANGNTVPGTSPGVQAGNTVTFTPSPALEYGKKYKAYVTAVSYHGEEFKSAVYNFTTQSESPVMLLPYPADKMSLNGAIEFEFAHNINPKSINDKTFKVIDSVSGQQVLGILTTFRNVVSFVRRGGRLWSSGRRYDIVIAGAEYADGDDGSVPTVASQVFANATEVTAIHQIYEATNGGAGYTAIELGGLRDADKLCDKDPANPLLESSNTLPEGVHFKAMLGSEGNREVGSNRRWACVKNGDGVACDQESVSIRGIRQQQDWVLLPEATYYNRQNTIIASTSPRATFDSENFLNPINPTRDGNILGSWSGINTDWTVYQYRVGPVSVAADCGGWAGVFGGTSVPTRYGGSVGNPTTVNIAQVLLDPFVQVRGQIFPSQGVDNCSARHSLICVQQ